MYHAYLQMKMPVSMRVFRNFEELSMELKLHNIYFFKFTFDKYVSFNMFKGFNNRCSDVYYVVENNKHV